jgi:Phenazine biosynthesis-like protein
MEGPDRSRPITLGLVTDKHRTDRLWADKPGNGWRRYLIADVFTATPLEGNQLAVFPDGRGLGSDVMQRTARELNLGRRSSSPAASTGSAESSVDVAQRG